MDIVADISSWTDPDNDVSQDFNWHAAKAAGLKGVFIKATEGANWPQNISQYPQYKNYIHGVKAVGLPFGLFHFASWGQWEVESNHFSNFVQAAKPNWIALDAETNATHLDQIQWCRDFNHSVFTRVNLYPEFYSNSAWIEQRMTKRMAPLGDGLWLANYGADLPNAKPFNAPVPPPWTKVLLHQYTSKGTWPGIPGPVDLSACDSVSKIPQITWGIYNKPPDTWANL